METTQPAMPWVDGTKDDGGTDLVLDDHPTGQIVVKVEGDGRPRGSLVQVRWLGLGDGTSPSPPYETGWSLVTHANAPLDFEIPVSEANLRPGTVRVSYTVLGGDGTSVESLGRPLTVTSRGTLVPPDVPSGDGTAISLGISGDTIEVVAPRQPELVPPASRLRFYWESQETGLDRCRGWDECFAPEDTASLGHIPASAIARLQGRHMRLWYEVDVYAAGGAHLTHRQSEPVVFEIAGDAGLLPKATIVGTTANTLRLSDFPTDLALLIPPWPGMTEGQTVWIELEGVCAEGPASLIAADGEPVTRPMLADGFSTSVAVSTLPAWKDGSVVTLRGAISFTGGSRDDATELPVATLTLLRDSGNEGRAVEIETFDGLAPLAAGETQRYRFFELQQKAGQLTAYSTSGTTGYEPYLKGLCASMAASGGSTVRIVLDHPAARVELGARPANESYPGTVVARDREGEVVANLRIEKMGWIDIRPATETTRIASIDISNTGTSGLYFDNLKCHTGSAWNEASGELAGKFDDLVPGEHGDTFVCQTWSVSAPGADIAIIPDSLSGNGMCLAVRMAPEGRTHYLTPRFGIRPRVRAELRVRTSGTVSHTAKFEIVLINKFDHTVRVFSQEKTVGPQETPITFATAQLPTDDEYVSHFRIVHNSGKTVTAVIYDDIVLE
ncbi:hypothetical protein SAMN02800692_2996 [Luteibacter sp. UNC138MFCol5.1]|nr:hypothetical protein SAMN02800692_2996 [Luteibacter sp. UNC138MFCol5.1]